MLWRIIAEMAVNPSDVYSEGKKGVSTYSRYLVPERVLPDRGITYVCQLSQCNSSHTLYIIVGQSSAYQGSQAATEFKRRLVIR